MKEKRNKKNIAAKLLTGHATGSTELRMNYNKWFKRNLKEKLLNCLQLRRDQSSKKQFISCMTSLMFNRLSPAGELAIDRWSSIGHLAVKVWILRLRFLSVHQTIHHIQLQIVAMRSYSALNDRDGILLQLLRFFNLKRNS